MDVPSDDLRLTCEDVVAACAECPVSVPKNVSRYAAAIDEKSAFPLPDIRRAGAVPLCCHGRADVK